jgi:ferrous iron transport protein B
MVQRRLHLLNNSIVCISIFKNRRQSIAAYFLLAVFHLQKILPLYRYNLTYNLQLMNTRAADNVLAHPFWGVIVGLLLMWLMFYVTFAVGAYPARLIEYGIECLSALLMHLPDTLWRSFLVDGIVGGVGGVITFLPNVLILFLFITIFEESGYIYRIMLVADRFMHIIGLHGYSFLPLVMGFGCNVPAIVTAGHLQDKHQRWLTIFLIPFMSCNARLPVFVLITGAFFAPHAATVLFLLYLIGISVAAISGMLISLFFKKNNQQGNAALLPYRIPRLRPTIKKVWGEASDYLKKITNVVLVASAIIWVLGTFPLNAEGNPAHTTYLQRVGETVAPALAPLGFDWKMSLALVTGVVAKETIVSTLAVLYPVEEGGTLEERLRTEPNFTSPTAAAFLIFILLYFPCIAVVGSIYKATRSIWFTVVAMCYTTSVAWVCAFLTQHIGTMLI